MHAQADFDLGLLSVTEPLNDVPRQAITVLFSIVALFHANVIIRDMELLYGHQPFFELHVIERHGPTPGVFYTFNFDKIRYICLLFRIIQKQFKQSGIFAHRVFFKLVITGSEHIVIVFQRCSNEVLETVNREESFLSVEVIHHWYGIVVLVVQHELGVPHELLSSQLGLRLRYERANENAHEN